MRNAENCSILPAFDFSEKKDPERVLFREIASRPRSARSIFPRKRNAKLDEVFCERALRFV